jgi:hypothetical protein
MAENLPKRSVPVKELKERVTFSDSTIDAAYFRPWSVSLPTRKEIYAADSWREVLYVRVYGDKDKAGAIVCSMQFSVCGHWKHNIPVPVHEGDRILCEECLEEKLNASHA